MNEEVNWVDFLEEMGETFKALAVDARNVKYANDVKARLERENKELQAKCAELELKCADLEVQLATVKANTTATKTNAEKDISLQISKTEDGKTKTTNIDCTPQAAQKIVKELFSAYDGFAKEIDPFIKVIFGSEDE